MKEFCPNKASKEFKELASIFGEDKAYFLWMRNKGNELDKAPNGAESKLFLTLLDEFDGDRVEALKAKAKVYSNDFLNWFGDWINLFDNLDIYQEKYLDFENSGRTYVGKSGKSIPIMINKGVKYAKAPERTTPTKEDPFGFNSVYVDKTIVVGGEIDQDRPFDGICLLTSQACQNFLKDRYGIKSNIAIIYAKSPVKDEIINHWVTVLSIDGKAYIYDMPLTEYILRTNPFVINGKTYYEGVIKQKYTPRLIKVTKENLSKYYEDNNENDLQIEVIKDIADELTRDGNSASIENLIYRPVYGIPSKVVDENGEPLVVWHGGARDIKIFRNGSNGSTTETGYYTDEKTGEKIPTDANRAMFFSSNKHVATSYALLYANGIYKTLFNRTQSLISTFYGGKASISHNYFKSLDDLYKFLEDVSEFNPRFAKLKDYIKSLLEEGKRMPENAVNAARELFVKLRSELQECVNDWNLVLSEWDDALETGKNIIEKYNTDSGIDKLMSGEIPAQLKKEYELFQKLQQYRIKNGKGENGFLETATAWLSSRSDYINGNYILTYDGKTLLFDYTKNPDEKRNIPISKMSKEEILKFFDNALIYNKLSVAERNEDAVKQKYQEKSQRYPVFLNIKNPLIHDYEGTHQGQGYKESNKYSFGYIAARQVNKAIKDGNDGVVYLNLYDPYLADNYGVFDAGLIKSAISNKQDIITNTPGFSTEDNNIYHESFNQVNTSLFTKDSMLKQAYEDRIKDGKNMSIEEALNYISRTEVGASVVSLINYISKSKGESLFPKGLDIRIVSGIAMPHTAGPKLKGHRACYDADTKTIYIDSDSSYENGDASNVLLHEIMHAITLHLLANNEQARVKLQGVLDIYRKSYPDQYLNAESHSLEEFVADIWTNPTTISRLKNIPYKTESLFDRVINILKQLFKSFFKEDTLFAEASKTLVELLESTPPNRKGTAGIYYAALPTNTQIQKEYDLISDKIRSLFSELYKRFDKMPNKSNTRRKTLTQIFKTIQHLKEELTDKAIEIALLTAAELLGVINQQTGASQSSGNLYAWFINQESKDVPYDNVTPQQLLDIYKYQIGFYRSVLATIPDGASSLLNPTTRLNRQDVLSLLDIIENFWKHAVEMVGEREIDNMIDSFTGLAIPLDQKENMKIVYRDWLHKNWFHGDINAFTRLFTSYGQSGNPIVKIAFHLTQYAEQKTQEELLATSTPLLEKFQAVNTAASWTKPGWQKIFQEVNRDGIPTGKWVRDINYGQYEQDLDEFVKELNEDFDTRYGYHYIYDDLGMPKNSVTGVYAEDEEWTNGILPTYVEYLLEMYRWKCNYANLPYTFEYYSERLSRPYDEVNYPEGHGLSLKTLQQYQNLQDTINYYLGLCTGEDGIPHPELPKSEGGLTTAERMELDKAKDDLYRLSSPFEDDGTPKVDEEYQTAMEILTWQKYISDKQHGTNIDYASFALAEAEAKNQATLKNDPSILYNFYKYNSEVKIDPDFLEAIFGQNENKSSADIIIKQIHQKCLERLSKIDNNVYSRDIEPFKNNVEFWMMYRLIVQDVSDGKQYRNIEKPDLEFEDVAEYCSIVYTDPNGNTYDVFGNVATSATPTSDLMTWFGYMVNHYKDIAIANNGTIPGVNDLYGNPVVFYGSDMQIYDQVKDALFTYERTWFDKLGLMHTQRDPLPLFTVLLPKDRSLIQNVPTGRFSKPLYNPFENDQFDKNAGISEQPKRLFYDNSEAYNKVMKNKNVKKLYLSCIQVMKDMQKVMGFNNKTFNYKLPMLNADTSALFSRGDFKSILKSVYEVQNDDSDMRNLDGAIKKLDGTIDFDIPLRLLYDLKDMRNLTSDVVLSVILYAQMAYNYRNKKAIQDTMLTIHDNLTPEVRNRIATDYDRFNGTNMDAAIDDEESLKQYEAMMDSTMYGLDTGKLSKAHKEATKGTIAARKIGNATVRMEALATLGLNLLSMFAGGFDSITKMLRESLLNRYMSFIDLIKSFGYVLLYLPKVIMNWGNPLPNCKIVGAMQLNSVSKDYTHIFDNLNHNRLIRTANRLLMGGFSMFDYFSNMIMLRAHYRNVRFYDGDVIPKGFYTAYEMRLAFKQAGMSWLEGSLAHSMCKNSLWSAYEFKDHKFVVRDEYISKEEAEKAAAGGVGLKWSDFVTDKVKTDIRTKSQQRSALYNGMAPDNDRAAYLKAIWGKVIFAMRNWYQMVLQRNLVGTDDTSVRKVVNTEGERIKYGKAAFKPGKKVEGITEEQSANRMGWNFETNAPLEEIWKATARSAWKLLRMGWALLHLQLGKVKNIKLSNVEKYAIRGIFTQILIILLLYHAFIPIMQSTKKIAMPTNKLEAELSISNLLDNLSDLPTLWLANATIRSYESNVAELSVVEPKNFVKTPSALFGVFDKQIALWMMAQEGLGMSSHTLDETINSGSKYKYFTRGERYLWQASGIGNNLMTSLTIQGVEYNTQWYMNMYGDSFRRDGYEFSIGARSKNASGGHKLKRSGLSKKLKRTKPSKKLRR